MIFDYPYILIWAKLHECTNNSDAIVNGREEEYHPLICHMIDTAMVVQAMWDYVLPMPFKKYISTRFNDNIEKSGIILSFLAALHDIGKASPAFQGKWVKAKGKLQVEGYNFGIIAEAKPHGIISAAILRDLLDENGWDSRIAGKLGVALGGHHGIFPRVDEILTIEGSKLQVGDSQWINARRYLFSTLATLLGISEAPNLNEDLSEDDSFFIKIAGLTSVADWIASSAEHFPFAGEKIGHNMSSYLIESKIRAESVLKTLGWSGWSPDDIPKSFAELFDFNTLRPLQIETVKIAEKLDKPSLVIIEAPMGEGKTEAALFLQDYWQAVIGQKGFYIALPTQATSNQMFERIKSYLRNRYPEDRINLNLLHGQADLSESYNELRLNSINDEYEKEENTGKVVAEAWFAPKKRGLLAPFAVGTVDQALLAVLQVKHGFVRLFGLSDKVVVIDEVHAYDTYTSKLIDRLIEWLSTLDTSVILLSATLPKKRKMQLLKAFDRSIDLMTLECRYPRIIWISGSLSGCVSFDARPQPYILLEKKEPDHNEIAKGIIDRISGGGCGAWICNTVTSAQNVYETLKPLCERENIELILFHSRFPFEERDAIERKVLNLFGKKSLIDKEDPGYFPRPERAVLVATQVVEQSLDIDFDIMISELAPIDLLLQRAGRIHRHNRIRPDGLKDPILWVINPVISEIGFPDFGPSAAIYSEYILLKSWLVLKGLDQISISDDMEELIESVYGDLDDSFIEEMGVSEKLYLRLKEKCDEDIKENRKNELEAKKRIIKPPYGEFSVLDQFSLNLIEDDPGINRSIQAITRLGEPSVTAICLYKTSEGVSIDKEGREVINFDIRPDFELTRKLLKRAVSASHVGVFNELLKVDTPRSWRGSSHLRYCKPLVFENNVVKIGEWEVEMDKRLGIIIRRS